MQPHGRPAGRSWARVLDPEQIPGPGDGDVEAVPWATVSADAAGVYRDLVGQHEIAEHPDAEAAVREESDRRVARLPGHHLLDNLGHIDGPGPHLREGIGQL